MVGTAGFEPATDELNIKLPQHEHSKPLIINSSSDSLSVHTDRDKK